MLNIFLFDVPSWTPVKEKKRSIVEGVGGGGERDRDRERERQRQRETERERERETGRQAGRQTSSLSWVINGVYSNT